MNYVARMTDPQVRRLGLAAAQLAPEYLKSDDDPWEGSPFAWILEQPSRSKGAIGEKLVEAWAKSNGIKVARSPDSEADRVIAGQRVEIKFSTLWKNGGYKFQQIREQNYEYCLCLGISPFDAHAWLLPKDILREHVIGHMGQHTGAAGTETAWLGFPANDPYPWMRPYGGQLEDVKVLLERIQAQSE